MVRHNNSKHKQINYNCYDCPKSFTEKYNLASHIKMIHRNEPGICPYCGKVFSSQLGLHLYDKYNIISNIILLPPEHLFYNPIPSGMYPTATGIFKFFLCDIFWFSVIKYISWKPIIVCMVLWYHYPYTLF